MTALDAVPEIGLLQHLPLFLGGLFNMLSDSKRDIRVDATASLSDFLVELRESHSVDYATLIKVSCRPMILCFVLCLAADCVDSSLLSAHSTPTQHHRRPTTITATIADHHSVLLVA